RAAARHEQRAVGRPQRDASGVHEAVVDRRGEHARERAALRVELEHGLVVLACDEQASTRGQREYADEETDRLPQDAFPSGLSAVYSARLPAFRGWIAPKSRTGRIRFTIPDRPVRIPA